MSQVRLVPKTKASDSSQLGGTPSQKSMGETPTTSNLNIGPTRRSFIEIRDAVKHLEEAQKDVLKDISVLVSIIRKLHAIAKKQQFKRKREDEFAQNKKSCRMSQNKVELELDKDLQDSFNEDIDI